MSANCVMVDSTVWIDYFKGIQAPHTERLDQALATDLVLVGDLILAEVLQGFRSDRDFSEAKAVLSGLQQVEIVGFPVALASAHLYRQMRQKGVTIRKTIDMLIATYCIFNKIPLLHCDRDFEHIETFNIGLMPY